MTPHAAQLTIPELPRSIPRSLRGTFATPAVTALARALVRLGLVTDDAPRPWTAGQLAGHGLGRWLDTEAWGLAALHMSMTLDDDVNDGATIRFAPDGGLTLMCKPRLGRIEHWTSHALAHRLGASAFAYLHAATNGIIDAYTPATVLGACESLYWGFHDDESLVVEEARADNEKWHGITREQIGQTFPAWALAGGPTLDEAQLRSIVAGERRTRAAAIAAAILATMQAISAHAPHIHADDDFPWGTPHIVLRWTADDPMTQILDDHFEHVWNAGEERDAICSIHLPNTMSAEACAEAVGGFLANCAHITAQLRPALRLAQLLGT